MRGEGGGEGGRFEGGLRGEVERGVRLRDWKSGVERRGGGGVGITS